MSKNVLVINGHQYWEISPGRLNATLAEAAKSHLEAKGYAVAISRTDDPYVPAAEVERFVRADFIIFQTPVYWMSVPWGFKKYIDEVYSAGYGRLFADDGRGKPGGLYGSGGLLQGRKYMLSTTWNAPTEAFTDPAQFFEGKDVDAVFFPFHKTQEFVGLDALPTFTCHDVMKKPDAEGIVKAFVAHLDTVF